MPGSGMVRPRNCACGTVASANFWQLVIGKALDLPFGRRVAVLARLVRRTEHHQDRPPPAIQSILRHRLLPFGAAAQRQHDFETLALVKGLFLADADHCPRRVRRSNGTTESD